MFSHIMIGVSDFSRAFEFYSGLMQTMGLPLRFHEPHVPWAGWSSHGNTRPLLVIRAPFDGQAHHAGNGQMIALTAANREMVDTVYTKVLSSGGTDEGAPGVRPQYHANYYGAYFRDTEGNKLAIACHNPLPSTQGSRPLQSYRGSCHCQAVKFEIDTDCPELTTCDCSICVRKNALMVKVHESSFRLLQGEDALTEYQFHTHTARHFFCKVCGIYPFHRKRVTPDFVGVNVYCLEGFDTANIPVRATIGAGMK